MIMIYMHKRNALCFTCAVKRAAPPCDHPIIVPQVKQQTRQDIECDDCNILIEEEV